VEAAEAQGAGGAEEHQVLTLAPLAHAAMNQNEVRGDEGSDGRGTTRA
jgi:hypothetical protein